MLTEILNIVIAYSVPVILWLVWRRKASARVFALVVGILSYMFISLFRAAARIVVLNDSVKENVWLFYFMSAMLSGVFEEVGRYVVFRYIFENSDRRSDSVSYGFGHGAIEIVLTRGIIGNTFLESAFVAYDFASIIVFSSAMSVLVYAAAHYENSRKYLALAIVLHTTIDFFAGFFFSGLIDAGEMMLLDMLFVAGTGYLGFRVYKRL